MAVKPILMSGPMVRAILEGRKTQTRRTLKAEVPEPPGGEVVREPKHPAPYLDAYNRSSKWCWWTRDDRCCLPLFEVGYAVGDLLWVRETWATTTNTSGMDNWPDRPHITLPPDLVDRVAIWAADGDWDWCDGDGFRSRRSYWKPSIHMPRWASRLTLEVTAVKVERLQDISEDDAIAEGVTKIRDSCHVIRGFDHDTIGLCHTYAVTPFAKLWDSLAGPDAWDADPWVVALTFTVHKCNVDDFVARVREAAE